MPAGEMLVSLDSAGAKNDMARGFHYYVLRTLYGLRVLVSCKKKKTGGEDSDFRLASPVSKVLRTFCWCCQRVSATADSDVDRLAGSEMGARLRHRKMCA